MLQDPRLMRHPSKIGEYKLFLVSLSGGGFRASLYHAGILRAMFEKGLLEDRDNGQTIINAVSGGTIPSLLWDIYINTCPRPPDPFWPEITLLKFISSTPSLGGQLNWLFRRFSSKYSWGNFLQCWWNKVQQGVNIFVWPSTTIILIEALDYVTGHIWVFNQNKILQPDQEFFKSGWNCSTHPIESKHLAIAASTAYPIIFPRINISIATRYNDTDILSFLDAGVIDNMALLGLMPLFDKVSGKSLIEDGDVWFFSDAGRRLEVKKTYQTISYTGPIVDRISPFDFPFRLAGQLAQPIYADRMQKFIEDYAKIKVLGARIGLIPPGESPWQCTKRLSDQRAVTAIKTGLCPIPLIDAICVISQGAQTSSYSLGMTNQQRNTLRSKMDSLLTRIN